MEDQTLTPRQERAAERLLEDEGLTGDLPDDLAQPLVRWATEQAVQIAAPEERSDEQVSALLKLLRKAIYQASAQADEVNTAQQLLDKAAGFLAELAPELSAPSPATEPKQTLGASPEVESSADSADSAAEPPAEAKPVAPEPKATDSADSAAKTPAEAEHSAAESPEPTVAAAPEPSASYSAEPAAEAATEAKPAAQNLAAASAPAEGQSAGGEGLSAGANMLLSGAGRPRKTESLAKRQIALFVHRIRSFIKRIG